MPQFLASLVFSTPGTTNKYHIARKEPRLHNITERIQHAHKIHQPRSVQQYEYLNARVRKIV